MMIKYLMERNNLEKTFPTLTNCHGKQFDEKLCYFGRCLKLEGSIKPLCNVIILRFNWKVVFYH